MRIFVTTAKGEEIAVQAVPGYSLAQAVYLSGFFDVPPLCSGHGAGISRCGRCRMRFEGLLAAFPASPRDMAVLGGQAVREGWRLACRIDCRELARHLEQADDPSGRDEKRAGVTLPNAVRIVDRNFEPAPLRGGGSGAELPEVLRVSKDADAGERTRKTTLAVDFGTTSICWKFSADREDSADARMVNPQMGAGSDIMSRLALAHPARELFGSGRERLRVLSAGALSRILDTVKAGARTDEIVVAGNPAMMYLLLGKDVSGLCAAPYKLDYRGGTREILPACPNLPPCWICPLISPFVGGDISAGYASLVFGGRAVARSRAQYPFLLADLGTNGEFILALDERRALAASLPLGPALEGMGLCCGSEAREGVITGFQLAPEGLRAKFFKNKPVEQAQGLSATAYLELLMHLLKLGLVDQDGHFKKPEAAGLPAETPLPLPLIRKLAGRLGGAPASSEAAWHIADNFYISSGDIEEILKIKAAFSLAVKTLVKEAGLTCGSLRAFYLAGALGSFVTPQALAVLGFVPEELLSRLVPAGNTALDGAALLAGKPELREKLIQWAALAHTLSLAGQEDFHNRFTEEMRFRF
ncbi:MAG: ASKHA domain-containing protein [Deltaproteobacteria bacterium]|jgi:uncharacterized 2Fe-2S/4Fe-4S cluster protein (DUF4445 family)|nr:ASKHA domain-containing protein [Deltaproteobacteria bacterium]